MADLAAELAATVRDAYAQERPLSVQGSGTKSFLGEPGDAAALETGGHRGILSYAPTELVLTARAGTPLTEIEERLDQEGQMLAFEPPHYGDGATLGGTLACALSGPRRPYAGAARDFVLGCRLINGKGEILAFGGEVMKNVAGYDLSRLQIGAHGSLGVMLEISLKVLPRPETELTLVQEYTEAEAIAQMNTWAGKPLPLSGACYDGEHLYVRLSGAATAVRAARTRIGGEEHRHGERFWRQLREHELAFFDSSRPLWRCAVAPAAAPLALDGKQLIDWGGGQRWLYSREPVNRVRTVVEQAGGHASLYRNATDASPRFHPLTPGMLRLHQRLKQSLDPAGILNRGRMYPEL